MTLGTAPPSPREVQPPVRAALPTIGATGVRLHDVRHAYVTALLSAGVPLKVVSQRVGHASPTVTMTIYQHVLSGDDEAAAAVGARVILGQE
ncbi:MAG TPA: tyrosine-type recombinase/integrase [Acidimicrobiales bacterium]|nr:tyrosine-type recombinase/integrase [Acidimicrobiales bacterium]